MRMKILIAVAWLAGCSGPPPELETGLEGLAVDEVHPALVLPGSTLDLVGQSFVGETQGLSIARLEGTFTPAGGAERSVEVELPARYVDARRLAVNDVWDPLGGASGRFTGTLELRVESALDHRSHFAPPVPVDLMLDQEVTPRLDSIDAGTIHVNDDLPVRGHGLLLGGAEGETRAVVDGCFLAAGASQPCSTNGRTVAGVEVTLRAASPWSRSEAVLRFAPAIAGIHPGSFSGTVSLRNVLATKTTASGSLPLVVTIDKPTLGALDPATASLGQLADWTGAGFVGGEPGSVTVVRLVGQLVIGGASPRPVDVQLVPRFVDGHHLRYVFDEGDQLGRFVNLRSVSGLFRGSAQPVILASGEQEVGLAAAVAFRIAPPKQVVYLRFAPSYAATLARYGLAAAEERVRDRVLAVARRDYAGVNVEWRLDPPTDFALFSEVDLVGSDPNGLGLLGYDNTPGKDVGNSRLYDRIGGVNAATQADGFPGYGGVFVEEFFAFSRHPPDGVRRLPGDTPSFDAIFDPLRPDSGRAATRAEVADAPIVENGAPCPAGDRALQIGCAIFVLGNLVGTTLTHEVGHSLGLANPYGDGYHNAGDLPNRLMEAGDGRPFEERTELSGQGPGRFCGGEYAYLRSILPVPGAPDPYDERPSCN